VPENNFDIEEHICKLSPFKDLPGGDRLKMAKRGARIHKEPEDTMYASDFSDQLIYLLEGSVEICHQYVKPHIISEAKSESLKPLFYENDEADTHLIVKSACVLLVFDRNLFNR